MKYIFSILFVLIFLFSVKTSYCQDEKIWIFICTSNTGETYYLDSLSVTISGDCIEYLDKAVKEGQSEYPDSRTSKERIYISTNEYITLQSIYFSYSEGIWGENFPYGENRKAIVPGSVMETFYNYLYEKYWGK
jgi:hypothetical protein